MQKKKKSKKRIFCQAILIFLAKKVVRFWEERLECFSLHLDSDFSLVTFFELFRPCQHSMPNPPSFGFALPKPSFLFKFFD